LDDCASKGEFVNSENLKGKTKYPDFCCSGLKGLIGFRINENGECESIKGTPYLTCMPCGNGVCEKSETNRVDENKCNCPEDCGDENIGIGNETEIYSVDALVASKARAGAEFVVAGRYNVKLVSAGSDYEGLGGGDYLFGDSAAIYLNWQKNPENIAYDDDITVKGKVRYCGGDAISQYICGLDEVEIVDQKCVSEGDGGNGRLAVKNDL